MPGTSGLDGHAQDSRKHAGASHPDAEHALGRDLVRQALDAGARGYVLKNAVDLELACGDPKSGGGRDRSRSAGLEAAACAEGRSAMAASRTRELEILQLIVDGKSNKEIADRARPQRQYGCGAPRQYHGRPGHSQDGGTGGVCDSQRAGEHSVNRRSFLARNGGLASAGSLASRVGSVRPAPAASDLGFQAR